MEVVFILIVIILISIISSLAFMAYMQIKATGMQIKDFWSFVKAHDTLHKLYKFSTMYEKLPPNEQLVFIKEAEEVFSAFDKVPDALWEEEYNKYMKVLAQYQSIKVRDWKRR